MRYYKDGIFLTNEEAAKLNLLINALQDKGLSIAQKGLFGQIVTNPFQKLETISSDIPETEIRQMLLVLDIKGYLRYDNEINILDVL